MESPSGIHEVDQVKAGCLFGGNGVHLREARRNHIQANGGQQAEHKVEGEPGEVVLAVLDKVRDELV